MALSTHQVIAAFADKLAQFGIRLADPDSIKLDGQWHRADVDGDKRRSGNLSYKIFFDDRPAGFFEDHKRGVTGTFSVGNGADMDPAERAAAQARWRAQQAERAAEQERAYAAAAERAAGVYAAATPAPDDHPYLARKGLAPTSELRVDGDGNLVVPVYSDFGKIASLQTIAPDGDKLFMPGGRMAGGFHPIKGTDKRRVLVCEGYATGAALNAVTAHPVACAMSAGNLARIVQLMQTRFPDREIVAMVDNDHGTERERGVNPGIAAADGLDVRVLAPAFPPEAGPKETDWDDWLRCYGTAGELRAMLDGNPDPTPDPRRGPPEPAQEPPAAAAAPVTLLDTRIAVSGALLPRITAELDAAADPDDDGLPELYSEDNVALRFSQIHADDLRYVAPWSRWMLWDGQRWRHDETMVAFDRARRVCRAVAAYVKADHTLTPKQQQTVAGKYGTSQSVASVERLAKSDRRHAATIGQWDADLWGLNTPAGVVDLRTGALKSGDRLSYMTKITNVAPGGACPTWLRFLDTATAGDHDLIAFLQRMAGYSLTGSTRDHALFFVYGTGGNGKGTFLNTFQWILGDYAKPASMDMFTERKHESHPTELAGLMGARLVTAQETEEGKRWAEARIKALTGGDPITARFMRQDNFEFMPQFKLVIAGNHKPGLRNVDEAIKRRLHLIPFTVTIPAEKRDVDLPEKLRAEASGILAWAIEGCLAWQRDGLKPPASVLAATEEYLEQQDALAAWMEECCEVSPSASARRGDLYRSYKSWSERASEYALPQKRWIAAMESRGFLTATRDGYPMYKGIRVATEVGKQSWGWDGSEDVFP